MWNYIYCKVIVSVIFLIVTFVQISMNEPLKDVTEYQNPSHCKKYEIFNSSSLTCDLCNFTQNLEPSENRLHCVCNKNSKIVGFKNGVPLCESCKNGTVVTSDGLHCIKCKNDGKKCSCLFNEIQIEKNESGSYLEFLRCLPCPVHMYPSLDKSQCITNARFSYGDLTKLSFPFFTKNIPFWTNNNGLINDTIDSYYIKVESKIALALCKNGSLTACEHLSNMCTLSIFSNKILCEAFSKATNGQVWLFYNKNENTNILNDDSIPVKYSLKSQDTNSKINVTIITHKLNGEFHSIDKPDIYCDMLENIIFGININKSCTINARALLNRKTLFYSPYLTYKDNGKLLLYNIPILVKNINKVDSVSQWQLVKKFIFVDNVNGHKLSNSSDVHSSTIRYLQSLSLILTVQLNNENKIYCPLIVVQYRELSEEHVLGNQKLSIRYEVKFVLQTNNVNRIVKIIIGVLSGLAILYSMLKTWSYCKRNHDLNLHPLVLLRFLIFTCGLVANVLIFVTISLCIYIFVLYKGQTILHVPLPDAEVEKSMIMYVIIAFAFKSIELIHFIYHHRNISIFFVDWEQPRKIYTRYLKNNSPLPARKSRQKRHKSASSAGPRKRKRHSTSLLPRTQFSDSQENLSIIYKPCENVDNVIEYQADELPVSVWRTYFVANEWFELQTMRKTSMLVHVISILFVLEVIGLKHYSRAIPELKLKTEETIEYNLTLLYGIGLLIYIIVYILQRLFIGIFYETCINNKIQHFVDLCSVANISVFILIYNYYGFYIHGRSVHGFADTDLETLTNDLLKEENNLCAHRGLVPGSCEQTFVISLSPSFRYFYDKLLNEYAVGENNRTNLFQSHEVLDSLAWQNDLKSHLRVKKFLTGFIDHCFYEMDYTIKDKLIFEKLLDIEFQSPIDKSIFYTDYKHNFDEAMLYGNEWTLGTFEIILFIFVLTFSKDYITSSLTTLLVSQLVIIFCRCNGKKNLAKKTLIDERFIM